jgi:hypothetical protein
VVESNDVDWNSSEDDEGVDAGVADDERSEKKLNMDIVAEWLMKEEEQWRMAKVDETRCRNVADRAGGDRKLTRAVIEVPGTVSKLVHHV